MWATFKPFVERFTRTWREFSPYATCTICAVCCVHEPTEEVRELFVQLPVEFVHYPGNGCDIGASQYLAMLCGSGFQVNMTTRCYLYQEGWLSKLLKIRDVLGPTIYGTSASREGGALHICTRAYSMDSEMIRAYPVKIDSRNQGTFYEVGADNPLGSLTQWVRSLGCAPIVVNTSGAVSVDRYQEVRNRFRDGDQSEMLVLDKHTDLYRDAEPEEKLRLENLAKGLTE